jgi:hypothetical protein
MKELIIKLQDIESDINLLRDNKDSYELSSLHESVSRFISESLKEREHKFTKSY